MRVINTIKVISVCSALAFVTPVFAEDDITKKAESVISRLTVLDGLALRCQTTLEVMGAEGIASDACSKYLRNMDGKYFQTTMDDCKPLLEWHNKEIVRVRDSIKTMLVEQPKEANELLDKIKIVKAACSAESLDSYKNLLRPFATIKALNELE